MKSSIIIVLTVLIVACAPTTQENSISPKGAQHAFFPDGWEYSVRDFVMSLPIGYYECVTHRLAFASTILKDGTPRPVLDQQKYLVLPENALAPKRHFLVLDQRHLLIFSEFLELANGSPPKITVLERDDASWNDVTKVVVPEWARSPKTVKFAPDDSFLTVVSSDGKRTEALAWNGGRLAAK